MECKWYLSHITVHRTLSTQNRHSSRKMRVNVVETKRSTVAFFHHEVLHRSQKVGLGFWFEGVDVITVMNGRRSKQNGKGKVIFLFPGDRHDHQREKPTRCRRFIIDPFYLICSCRSSRFVELLDSFILSYKKQQSLKICIIVGERQVCVGSSSSSSHAMNVFGNVLFDVHERR